MIVIMILVIITIMILECRQHVVCKCWPLRPAQPAEKPRLPGRVFGFSLALASWNAAPAVYAVYACNLSLQRTHARTQTHARRRTHAHTDAPPDVRLPRCLPACLTDTVMPSLA
jgi:hypothetical protein